MRDTEGWRADGLPKLSQFFDAALPWVPGDQRCIYCPDRNASNPIRIEVSFGKSLIDTSLIGAERAASLQQQDGLFKLATFAPRLFRFSKWRDIHDRYLSAVP